VRWPWSQSPLEKRASELAVELIATLGDPWPPDLLRTGRQAGMPQWDEGGAEKAAAPAIEESIRRLSRGHSEAELGLVAAETYFQPGLWRWHFIEDGRGRAMDFILRACVIRSPPPGITSMIQQRIQRLLQFPCGHEEERFPHRGGAAGDDPEPYFRPKLSDCLELLLQLPPTPGVLDLTRRLVVGEFDLPVISATCWAPRERTPPRWYEILFSLRGPGAVPPGWIADGTGRPRAYEVRSHTLSLYFPSLMELLYRHGMLTDDTFVTAARHIPRLLKEASRRFSAYGVSPHYGRPLERTFVAMCLAVVDEAGWRLCQEMKEGDQGLLRTLERLRGSRFLLRAAALHSENRIGHVTYQRPWHFVFDPATMGGHLTPDETLAGVVVHLAEAELEPMSAEDRARVIEELRKFPRDTLADLLPLATHGRGLICEALEWQAAFPIVEEILRAARLQGDLPWWPSEMRSSPDPSYGVLDTAALRSGIERAGEALTKRIVKLFRQSGLELSPTLMLVEAVAGWNREAVGERIRKRNQPAVRAYGLLPILRGEDEVLERYLFFKEFAAGSKKFGMLRQGNEKAAAKAGLENLGRNASYGDATRLEWAMEARLGSSYATGKAWAIGGYEVRLSIERGEPEVSVSKDGRNLKSVPEAVKKSPEHAEVKQAVKQLRDQASRVRVSLENLMAEGGRLRRGEVDRLLQLPSARSFVTTLVWSTEGGGFGLLDAARMELVLVDGSRTPVPETLLIAHPYHLFRAGVLGAWQREIVHRRIEQPFKQVFRELYVPTPAEEETQTFSNRFAGKLLNAGVASRLFQVRGWKSDPGDVAQPYKVFPAQGLRAVFDFPDAGHILAETESVTSDRIYFERHPRVAGTWALEGDWVSLREVPPLVFSEVMRDADLVVSVAQRGEAVLSEEAFQRRGEVVKALLQDLGLPGVTIDGHYARVEGKLARYKVHLGTAHIFIEPGNYLCVVPDRWGKKHDKLFLPFADEGDTKFSEVISKILFLVNDDRIKDDSILRQIRQGGLGPVPLHA